MADNYRQEVDHWAVRNPSCPVAHRFSEDGPGNAKRFLCTYTLNGTTNLAGEWRSNKTEAKETAAREVVKIIRIWTPSVCSPLSSCTVTLIILATRADSETKLKDNVPPTFHTYTHTSNTHMFSSPFNSSSSKSFVTSLAAHPTKFFDLRTFIPSSESPLHDFSPLFFS